MPLYPLSYVGQWYDLIGKLSRSAADRAREISKSDSRAIDSVGRDPAVLVLVTPDVDSLCACRIVEQLLLADSIPYTIRPMAGMGSLAEEASSKVIRNHRVVLAINSGNENPYDELL